MSIDVQGNLTVGEGSRLLGENGPIQFAGLDQAYVLRDHKPNPGGRLATPSFFTYRSALYQACECEWGDSEL